MLFVQLQKEEQERNRVEADLATLREKSQQIESHNSLLQGQFKEQLAKLTEDVRCTTIPANFSCRICVQLIHTYMYIVHLMLYT